LKKISTVIKSLPVWSVIIFITIITIILFIYLPFQLYLFYGTSIKKVYYVDSISPAHLKIIKKFNKEYEGKIEVVPVNLPFYHFTTNDRKEILTRSLRSRSDGVDIFAVDLIWIPRFAKWGYSMDKSFSKETFDKVDKMTLKTCYINNQLVAFPFFMDIGVLYYRKDLIRALPNGSSIENKIQNSLTWDEFISLGKNYNPEKNPFYVFTGGDFEGMMCCYHELLSDEESNKIFHKNPINLNVPAAKKPLQLLVNIIQKYKYSPKDVLRFDEYNSYLYANEKNAVFMRGWVGYHKQYKSFLKDTSNVEKMDIAPIPHFKENKTSAVFGGWCLMISKFSNMKEEAVKFVDFMFKKENQEILYEEGGLLPINTEVYDDSLFLQKHKELEKIRKIMAWGKHRPMLENYTRISEIMSREFHKALNNEISVEDAMISVSNQIKNEKSFVK
jgi:multiple sugar transport system substrate-binding protein